MDNKFVRCEPDAPNRCQSSGQHGQCPYAAEPNFSYCPRHLASAKAHTEKTNLRNYRLNKFQARMEEFADNEQIKSLREEVGITRMLLEETINACNSSVDFVMSSNKISDLVVKIEKLVASCHKLELASGNLLDKTTILKLAEMMIEIIGKYITDELVINSISMDIIKAIGEIEGNHE